MYTELANLVIYNLINMSFAIMLLKVIIKLNSALVLINLDHD